MYAGYKQITYQWKQSAMKISYTATDFIALKAIGIYHFLIYVFMGNFDIIFKSILLV